MFDRVARSLKQILRVLGALVIAMFALAVVGTWIPAIPVLGSIGPLMISPLGSWIVVLSLVGALIHGLRWRRQPRRASAVMAMLAVFAAIGTAGIEARQIAAARAAGIDVDLTRTLTLREDAHTSLEPSLLTYGSDGGNPLRLVVYRPGATARVPAPVLVYVHGGGWGGGTPFDRAADMRWFADRGYLVLSVEYSLSSKVRPTWNIAEPQIGCALAWISANAAQLGGDTGHLALFGQLAGGNLVLNLASDAAAGRLRPACAGVVPPVAAVIAPYPVIDAVRMYRNHDLIAGPFARMMTTHYTGGTPETHPDRYGAISSGSHVNRTTPPTLMFPGLSDHLLPPDVATLYAARARAAGANVEVIPFPAGEHSFDQGEGSIGSQLVRNATLRFLGQHDVGQK